MIIAMGTPIVVKTIPEPKPETPREAVLRVAKSQVGIKERTGKNDGEVEKYIDSVGLNPKAGYPYCAAFNYWVGREALGKDVKHFPRSAWSPDHVKGGTKVTSTTQIKGGEAFGIYYSSKKRVGHTGLLKERQGANFITYEGNTSANAAVGSAADREGQGVYSKRRHWRTIYKYKDWIKD